ncbi:hypothetical protein NST99_20430 [Paenibacillus sp. FSL L8-0470]|uniref:hypothetical protein n=1 Tax=Paenibacillus sp. FSL L8-0470 TaxID=2954688 RepID=UPI0030FB6382
MKKKIVLIFGAVFLLAACVQFLFLDGFEMSDMKSLNINVMVSILSILATVIIIDNLVKKHETKKRLEDYYSILGRSHDVFFNKLKQPYIQIITKEPKEIELDELLRDLSVYIDGDFIRKKIKVLHLNPTSIFESKEIEIGYFEFLTGFKKTIDHEITLYLNRYASIIPTEVMNHICKISEILKDNMLVSPSDFGITDQSFNANTAKFEPKQFIDVFESLGSEISALRKINY